VTAVPRIAAIDALRGFALIGIYFFNILVMGGPIDSESPAAAASLTNPDWQIWWADGLFVRGAMRGLFSLLFGASTLLFLRQEARNGAYLRRCAWLFLFGVANSTLLLWPGDILIIYALAGPLLLLFRGAKPAALLTAAIIVTIALSLWQYYGALNAGGSNGPPDLSAEQTARLGGYAANLIFMWHKSLEWTISISTLRWVLDALAFMLIGMALYRLNVLNAQAPMRIYALLAILGFGLGLPLRIWQSSTAFSNGGDYSAMAEGTFQTGRLLMTLGWLGAFMLVWKSVPWHGLFTPLSALGRMALTGYLAQSAAAALIFSGFGFGLWDALGWPERWLIVPLVMTTLALFSMTWLKRFEMGPLEWLWRALTFGRAPRLVRAT
jgi:uncharacterized protein